MKKAKMGLRGLRVQIHLWLGLTLGVIGALLGLSGSILVYDDVVDTWLNPQRHALSGPQAALPLSQYAQRAEQALANGARAANIRLPDLEGGPVVVFVRARGDTGGLQRIYLDPPTGRVLDAGTGNDFVAWLHNFHESLTLREYKGREIVGIVGIAMLISSLSGIYLWWPAGGVRRGTLGFRRSFALHRNLHYTFGIWGVIVLAMLSFTGIFLGFPEAGRAVMAAFGTVSPSPRGIQSPEGTGPAIGPDDAAAIARQRYPDAKVIGLGFPAGPRGVYRVNLRESGDTTSRAATVMFIDPRSQAIRHQV
ncbi:MAG: PepSY-associated TM helix domain-containing protein, partial [Casimicrobiaceae bacterium]